MKVERQYKKSFSRTLQPEPGNGRLSFVDQRQGLKVNNNNLVQLMKQADLFPWQQIFINQHKDSKGWNVERLNRLIEWAARYKQITSVLGKMSYGEWNSIQEAYKDSSILGNKIYMPDKQLDPEQSPQGKKPTMEDLRAYNSYWAKKANPVSPNQNLISLITNQRKYETIISALSKNDRTSILDSHRTMGIELEFAQYAGPDLGAHTELAVSNDSILQSVPGEWVLETDDNQKLEIGVPPMYVIDTETGGINIDVISSIRGIVKTALETSRDKYKDGGTISDFVAEMPNQGLGKNWSKKAMALSSLAFKGRTTYTYSGREEVNSALGLHSGTEKNKYMYEQINLSMTAAEIAENIERQKL